MAFAFVNILEASIASKLHDYAREPNEPEEPDETHVRVLYQIHPMRQDEQFRITLPIKNATVGDLRLHMSKTRMFRYNGQRPDEMGFCGLSYSDNMRLPQ